MNRRISLSRLIAINWYGFRQIIDVEETILMSGVSGTEKSALLDLVQRVLLGENWRSNRAAAGVHRGRTEVSYVLCDTNTTRNGEPHYTNRSRASYIALEFTWPAEKGEPRRETWGWRIQYDSPTSDPRRVYFCIPERAGWESFSKANELLGEDEFKTFVRREYGHDCLFSSQREYLAEMATPHHREPSEATELDLAWLGALREPAAALLRAGSRLAQESLDSQWLHGRQWVEPAALG